MKLSLKKNKTKKDFNQSKNLLNAAYLFVIAASLMAWNTRFKGNIEGFSLPSLLAILALGFMWVHYLAAYLKSNYQADLNTKNTTKITQAFVLLAIIAHPVAIIHKLNETGYGLPPSSFKNFFGPAGAIFVTLGSISLVAFLAFEFKEILKNKPKVWSAVLKLNDLAMILIIFHGFKLGFVINSGAFYRYIWLMYGLSLLYFFYDSYIKQERLKKYGEAFIVALVLLALAFVGLATSGDTRSKPVIKKTSTTTTNNTDEEGYISLLQLSKNDGLNGNKCWIAVDSDVYDTSNNPDWKNGQHTPSNGKAKCGQDLTKAISQSPHGEVVLGQLPIVGKYRGE